MCSSDLSALKADLPAAWKRSVAERQADLVAGRFAPFSGPLKDNTGQTRLASGRLDDAQIQRMDWFVEGVLGSVPAR